MKPFVWFFAPDYKKHDDHDDDDHDHDDEQAAGLYE